MCVCVSMFEFGPLLGDSCILLICLSCQVSLMNESECVCVSVSACDLATKGQVGVPTASDLSKYHLLLRQLAWDQRRTVCVS